MTEASAESDRRGDRRAPITLRVDYKRLNTFFADYTKNISKGGTFIRTTRPLAIDTEFMFVLSLPKPAPAGAEPEGGAASADTFQLELRGVVKWVVAEADATDEDPAGMGIEFVFGDDSERVAVETVVTDMMHEALGARLASRLLGSG